MTYCWNKKIFFCGVFWLLFLTGMLIAGVAVFVFAVVVESATAIDFAPIEEGAFGDAFAVEDASAQGDDGLFFSAVAGAGAPICCCCFGDCLASRFASMSDSSS